MSRWNQTKEFIFAGDVAWHMDGVRLNRPKDAPSIKEPAELMAAELDWLNGLTPHREESCRSSSATTRNSAAPISNKAFSATDSSDIAGGL